MSTRLIQLSVDPDKTYSYSVSLSKASGTFSYSGIYSSLPLLKQVVDIQGLTATVERITPLAGPSETGHSIEGRMLPLFQRESLSVNFPEKDDGTPYYVQQLIDSIASLAGTAVNFSATNNPMKSYKFTGRFTEAMTGLAQEACGELVQQNGIWYIIPKGTSIGTFSIPIEDLISCKQSSQADIIDQLMGIISSIRSLYDEIYQIDKQRGQLEAELARLLNNEEALIDNSTTTNISMGAISFEFGCSVSKKPTPIPNNILIEGGTWETFSPNAGESLNPTNPNKKYYQVRPIIANGLPTGNMEGCTSIVQANLLYPISEPSNSSGSYTAKGLIFNLEMTGGGFGGTDYVPWGVSPEYRLVTQYDSGGNPTTVRQLYFGFTLASGLIWGEDDSIDGDRRLYRVNLEMSYKPTVVKKWRFAGDIASGFWAIVKNGEFNGWVGPDGIPYTVTGTALPKISSLSELDGSLVAENIVKTTNGSIAGSIDEVGQVRNLYREIIGQYNIDTRVIENGDKIEGFIGGGYSYEAWPGFLEDVPAYADYNIYTMEFMTLPLGSTPGDVEDITKSRLELELAKLDLAKLIAETKIACLTKELDKYEAGFLLSYIREAAEAWHAFSDTQEGQTGELSQNIKDIIANLEATATAKDDALMVAMSLVRALLVDVDITFLYDSVLPMPGNSLSLAGSMPGFTQSVDCGIVDSVSFNGYQVTVRAQKYGTR